MWFSIVLCMFTRGYNPIYSDILEYNYTWRCNQKYEIGVWKWGMTLRSCGCGRHALRKNEAKASGWAYIIHIGGCLSPHFHRTYCTIWISAESMVFGMFPMENPFYTGTWLGRFGDGPHLSHVTRLWHIWNIHEHFLWTMVFFRLNSALFIMSCM